METPALLVHSEVDYRKRPALGGIFEAQALLLALTIAVVTFGTAMVFLLTDGNALTAGVFLCGSIILVLSLYRIEWGFYFFIGMVFALDQFFIPGFNPWTFKLSYFKNLKETPFFPNMEAAVVNPLELQLFLLVFIWFFVWVAKKDRLMNPIKVWPAAALFFGALIYSFVYGLRTGGDFLPALWEVRALFYLGFLYIFVPQVIQTKQQVHTLFWILIWAITFKAIQGGVRFAELGFGFQGYETLTNHEDPVFILDLIIFLFALTLMQARTAQLPALIALLFPLLMGFYAGQRRAAYAAVVPAFTVLLTLLSQQERRKFMGVVAQILFVLVLYCAAFWNSEGKLGSPVRLVKSGLSNDKETAGERYNSNLYREIEKYDLAWTVRESPLTGIGFGNKYKMPLPLVQIEFPLRDYIPHDEVLWVLVKTGAIGFCLMWFYLDSFAFQGASIFSRLKDPYLKSVCAVAVVAIIVQIVISNFDLQLTYYRNMVFLGTLMGLVSALESMDRRERQYAARSNA